MRKGLKYREAYYPLNEELGPNEMRVVALGFSYDDASKLLSSCTQTTWVTS